MKKSFYTKPLISIVEYKNDDIITASGLRNSISGDNTEQTEVPLNTAGMLGFKAK